MQDRMDVPPSIIHSGKFIPSLSQFPELILLCPFLYYIFGYKAFQIYRRFKRHNLILPKIMMISKLPICFFAWDTHISVIHVSK